MLARYSLCTYSLCTASIGFLGAALFAWTEGALASLPMTVGALIALGLARSFYRQGI